MFGYVQTLAVDTLIVSASIDSGRAGLRTAMNVSLEGDTEVSYLRAWSIFLEFEPGVVETIRICFIEWTQMHTVPSVISI